MKTILLLAHIGIISTIALVGCANTRTGIDQLGPGPINAFNNPLGAAQQEISNPGWIDTGDVQIKASKSLNASNAKSVTQNKIENNSNSFNLK